MRLLPRAMLTLTATPLVVIALVAISERASVVGGFSRYVQQVEAGKLALAVPRLTRVYEHDGSWVRLIDDPRLFGRLLSHDETVLPPRPPPDSRGPVENDPVTIQGRATLYDERRRLLVGSGRLDDDTVQLPLTVGGVCVGWLGVRAITPFDNALDLAYLKETQRHLVGIAAAALGLSVLAGWWLTRRLLEPLFELSGAARRLARGEFDVRVAALARDELGQLAADFNALALTLGETDTARRQWVADTSHELRTPLTVLRAELEALLDGVRPFNHAAVESLQAEVSRLTALVEDLGELARSDRGLLRMRRVELDPTEVLDKTVTSFRPRFEARDLSITLDVGAGSWRVLADRGRLEQIFGNLLENTLRYTDAGGSLRINAAAHDDALVLRFEDSAPGVLAGDLPRLFERFFRADPSRSRAHGGAGLGLAICQRLTEAHGGTLVASHSSLGGLRLDLSLPLEVTS